jgi:hypothetical protein
MAGRDGSVGRKEKWLEALRLCARVGSCDEI